MGLYHFYSSQLSIAPFIVPVFILQYVEFGGPRSHSKQGILDAFCAVLALDADLSVYEWSYTMQLVLVELK